MPGEAKRNYKDSLFRSFFKEPANFIPTAETVTRSRLSHLRAVENTLFESALMHTGRNDVSYDIDGKVYILYESQSTVNGNMPLRFLLYLSALYERIVPSDVIYERKTFQLPEPRFFVFYYGREEFPKHRILRLSDAFDAGFSAGAEIMVDVYNIRYGKMSEIFDGCRPVQDYSRYLFEVETRTKAGMNLDDAVRDATRQCIAEDVMRDFLRRHEMEVFGMVKLIWNEEDAKKSYYRQGIDEGREQGIEQGKLSMIRSLLAAETPIEFIKKATGWTEADIRALTVP